MKLRLDDLVELDCPSCGYCIEVFLSDARCQVSRLCPVCKVRLDLKDDGGSLAGAEAAINEALEDLLDVTIELEL